MATLTKKTKVSFSALKVGEKLSETQYYIVEKIKGNEVHLVNDLGERIVVTATYAENCLTSAVQYNEVKKMKITELAALFQSKTNIVMSVNFNKKVKEEDVVKELMEAYKNSTPKEIESAFKLSVKKGLEGVERTMIGRHYGHMNELGRINFVDMEVNRDSTKDYDNRFKQVDPRTINWLIVDGVKYERVS
jgi:hypothetical protein